MNKQKDIEMRKTIGLVRVSTNKQKDGMTVQKKNMTELAKRNDFTITEWVNEENISGGKINREAISNLMVQIANNEIERLVVSSVTRMGRTLVENVKLIDLCEKNNVIINTYEENINTENSGGTLQLKLYTIFAQEELSRIQRRIKRTIKLKKDNGLKYNGSVAYGLYEKNGVLHEDEFEMKIVRNMKNLKTRGWSYYKIAMNLNDNDIPTKTRSKKGWAGEQVKRTINYHYNNSDVVEYVRA
jgi:site-specific DNA recombinase